MLLYANVRKTNGKKESYALDAIANEYVGHGASPRNLVPANNNRYSGWKK